MGRDVLPDTWVSGCALFSADLPFPLTQGGSGKAGIREHPVAWAQDSWPPAQRFLVPFEKLTKNITTMH